MRLAPLALALLLMPAASAEDLPDPSGVPAAARSLTDGTVQLTLTLGGSHESGDVLPLCPGNEPAPHGTRLIGTADTSCFEPSRALPSGWSTENSDRTPTCHPVKGGIVIYPEPAVHGPDPDEDCIFGIIDDLIGFVNNSGRLPLSLQAIINR